MPLCEVCAAHGVHARGPRRRIAVRWKIRIPLDLCRRHAEALKRSTIETEVRIARAADPTPRRTFRDETGREMFEVVA